MARRLPKDVDWTEVFWKSKIPGRKVGRRMHVCCFRRIDLHVRGPQVLV